MKPESPIPITGICSLDVLGKGLAGAGVGLSFASAWNNTSNGANAFKEWGKFGVDALAAATVIPKLARFSPVGLVYTAVDLGVQSLPDYTIQNGIYKGDVVNGWTGVTYRSVDYEANKIQNGIPIHSFEGFGYGPKF